MWLMDDCGRIRKARLNATDANREIIAVCDLVDYGQTVIFSKKHGRKMIDDTTGEVFDIARKENTFRMK